MSDEKKSPHVGKYVCYNAVDGGACWGRIKAECKINTMEGEKPAFVLEGRIVAYLRASAGMTIKTVVPGMATPVRTVAMNPQTGQVSDNVEFEVRRFKGDTVIRQDVIDLKRDVIDIAEYLGKIPEDTLFLALMRGRAEGLDENKALAMGLNQLVGSDSGFEESIKQELRIRMEKKK